MANDNEWTRCSCGQLVPKSAVDAVLAKRGSTRVSEPEAQCFCGMELEAGLCPNGHDPIRPHTQ